jgi:sortase A
VERLALAGAQRRGPLWRRTVRRGLARLFLAAGVLLVCDAGVALVWQEPFSAFYAHLQQERLAGSLRALQAAPPTTVERRQLGRLYQDDHRIAYLASQLRLEVRAGGAVGRIEIPRIGLSVVVVAGTGTSALRSGPGLYSQAVFPGMQGTVAIAGHRTTYLAPFRRINQLRGGDLIVLRMPYGLFRYTVERQRVVDPNALVTVIGAGARQLVLSACTPLYSASHRLLVFARLESVRPLGAAVRGT